MAVINYFDDVLEEAAKTEEVADKVSLKTLVEKYINEKEDDSQMIEIYHADTDTTEYQKVEPDTYKIIAIVDGQEVPLTYEIEAEVVVSIFFIPESERAWKILGTITLGVLGVGLLATGLGLGFFAGTAGAFAAGGWGAIGCLGLMAAGAGLLVGAFALGKSLQKKGTNVDKEQESLPYLNGAENESIIGQRYPFTLGKHLISPYISGSPYHETKVVGPGKALDGGQYYHVLYCAGYGPLKLTNFKLGESILAYNQSSESSPRKTILHGHLEGTSTDHDSGDITIKFKDNDVKLEILQAGIKAEDIKDTLYAWKGESRIVYTYTSLPKVASCIYDKNGFVVDIIDSVSGVTLTANEKVYTRDASLDTISTNDNDKYGTIYPRAVLEKEISANCLFVYDKDLETIQKENPSVIYYNRSIPVGFRNNTVRMSSSCPQEIEVELDFSNGLFATNQVKSSKKDNAVNKYYNIPMNIAVQWRFTGPNTPSSDAENPEGWHDFDCIYYSEGTVDEVHYNECEIPPSVYSETDRKAEIKQNRGLSPETKAEHNQNWLGHRVFKLNAYEEVNRSLTFDEITDALKDGYLTSVSVTENSRKSNSTYPYITTAEQLSKLFKYTVTPEGEALGYSVVNKGDQSIPYILEANDKAFEPHNADDFNINERRYVIKKTFTEEECRQLVGFTGTENILDLVEVRVIRITPCYLAEAGRDSETQTDMNYQDLFTWSYLRTKTFDKSKYVKALNDAKEAGTLDTISVLDYVERPQPIEDDINKFAYIALEAKEDPTGSMKGTLNKLSVISESFTPKYSISENKWYPENIWEENKYWHKTEDGIEEISQAEYEENVINDQENYIKQKKGNDFVSQIRDEIFIRDYLEKEDGEIVVSPMMKYFISESVARKYISSNTAAQMAHAITGSFLSSDAKTYDCIQMDKLSEFYKLCEDVTDGTKEEYTGLLDKYISTIDSCNINHIHSIQDFVNAGYSDTYFANTFSNEAGNESVAVSRIRNDGSIISQSQMDIYENEWKDGALSDESIILARMNGSNADQKTKYYVTAYNCLLTAYFESYYEFDQAITDKFDSLGITIEKDWCLYRAYEIFEQLKTIPINALRTGSFKDLITELNDCIFIHDGAETDTIYESYIIDVLEQTLQAGQSKNLCAESDGELHVKFECNGVITKELKLETLLQKILLTGRAYLKRSDENKYEPLMGRPNPYPVTVLNQRNCISKSNTKSYEELPCGFQVSCIDEADNYSTNDFYVMNKGEDYTDPSAKIEQFQLDYVTNKWQLASLARFNLATRLYQVESYTRTVGMLGYSISLGDTVLLQDDSLLIGTDRAGRIIELIQDDNYIYGFTTDEPFEYTGELDAESKLSVQGCTVIQPSQKYGSRCVTLRCATPSQTVTVNGVEYSMTVGLTNMFLLSLAVNKNTNKQDDMTDATAINGVESEDLIFTPKMDNVVAFGKVSTITSKAVVMQIKPSEKGQFTLSLVPYNEDLYRSGLGVPVFKSNMTINPTGENYGFNDNITQRNVAEKIEDLAGAQIAAIESELHVDEPPKPFPIFAVADRDGINLKAKIDTSDLANTIQKIDWEISVRSTRSRIVERVVKLTSNDIETRYNFVRKDEEGFELDGYPEAEELQVWSVRAVATNIYGQSVNDSSIGGVNINCDDYGTWKFNFERSNVYSEISDRTVYVRCATTYQKEYYGNTRFKVSIKRIGRELIKTRDGEYVDGDSIADSQYFAPDFHKNPYTSGTPKDGEADSYLGNEDNYKDEENPDGYVIVDSRFNQTLPLYGQEKYVYDTDTEKWTDSGKKIQNTSYMYKITAFNESGFEMTVTDYTITALCSSIVDIVYSHDYYKDLYVERLSAINANVGMISKGGFGQFEDWSNFWALSNLTEEESGVVGGVHGGSFRVGDEKEYVAVVPPHSSIGTEGHEGYIRNDTDRYMIQIKAGNITLTSGEDSSFNDGTYIYKVNDSTQRLKLSSNGFEIQKLEDGNWIGKGSFYADPEGNMTITNVPSNDDSLPKQGIEISTDSIIYHLENDLNDLDGGNAGNLNFVSGELVSKITPIINQSHLYDGIITKESESGDMCFVTNSDTITIGESRIKLDDHTIDDSVYQLNKKLGVDYFRWGNK